MDRILSVYPDELYQLVGHISRRQVDNMLAQLRLLNNPHLKPEDARVLVDDLLERRRQLDGGDQDSATLDVAGLEALKLELGQNSKSIGVKL